MAEVCFTSINELGHSSIIRVKESYEEVKEKIVIKIETMDFLELERSGGEKIFVNPRRIEWVEEIPEEEERGS